MSRRHTELWYALGACVAVTALYVVAYRQAGAFPAASGLVGHGIGVAGFLLMLMTETLYSIRKRATAAAWGSMASWLRFHIFTGLVGPYLVLLHTAWTFSGLAGIAMLLTAVVVASGIVGRYIYARTPREAAEGDDEPHRLAARRSVIATWYAFHVPMTWVLFATAAMHAVAALYYATLQR